MKPAETYKNWILQTQQTFYVEVWDGGGHHYIPVRNAKSEEEALEMAKSWIDNYEEEINSFSCMETIGDLSTDSYSEEISSFPCLESIGDFPDEDEL
ncbi:hypothetical protein NG798_06885 [Ancylothrix sp. C2]|uniref:hypothetical protein n=1 Tax=Ancylothrix sp. D3o TaxID=2953691 RepID=UPI0021BA6573|nr:hypothetical protein [Ancylothrix sp. D3o]MCT7949506.1 hypothetical protein [Ancylothrix sp. D3o]